jgi:hypothetical protein
MEADVEPHLAVGLDAEQVRDLMVIERAYAVSESSWITRSQSVVIKLGIVEIGRHLGVHHCEHPPRSMSRNNMESITRSPVHGVDQ